MVTATYEREQIHVSVIKNNYFLKFFSEIQVKIGNRMKEIKLSHIIDQILLKKEFK